MTPKFLYGKYADYRMGAVIEHCGEDKFGHVVGFSRNAHFELTIKVLWDDGRTTAIHPGNIKVHK